MQRLTALIAGTAIGLGVAAPVALASETLAATGNATSITATTADLNGVVYRDRVGARWLFEYSTNRQFDSSVLTTVATGMHGLVVVERKVSDLTPQTTYFWRVVLVVRAGTHTAQTFGGTQSFETAAPASAAPGSASSSSTTPTTPATTTTPAGTTPTSTTPGTTTSTTSTTTTPSS